MSRKCYTYTALKCSLTLRNDVVFPLFYSNLDVCCMSTHTILSTILQSSFYKAVRAFSLQSHLFDRIHYVHTAFSGGADSTALLICMFALSHELGFEVTAHHIRHGLRDSDSIDAQTARCTAEKLNIRYIQTDLTLGSLNKNIEEIARNARHLALEQAILTTQASQTVIATAHNGDENLETLLWRLHRGCGAEGATLAVKTHATIPRVRPLLCTGKAEIYQFLQQTGFEWAEDPTNAQDHYARNRIRHNLLPNIQTEFGSLNTIYRSLVHLNLDASALSNLADHIVASQMHANTWICPRDTYVALPQDARVQLLRHVARRLLPGYCPEAQFIERADQRLMDQKPSAKKSTDERICFSWTRHSIFATAHVPPTHAPIALTHETIDVWGLCQLDCMRHICVDPPKNTQTRFCFAYAEPLDQLHIVPAESVLMMRTSDGRQTTTAGLLKKMGVPEIWRKAWPILVCSQGPLWILAGPRSDLAPVPEPQTMAVLITLHNFISF